MARFMFRTNRIFAWFCVIIVNSVLTLSDPREEFYSHVVVKPSVYSENREKRDLKPNQGQNQRKLTITFSASKREFVLDLLMNSLLLPSHYFEKYKENGSDVIRRPMKNNTNHCHYQGKMRGADFSFVAVSTCRGLSGVINDGSETYYIEPDTSSDDNSHFLFRARDLKPKNVSCGVSDSSQSSSNYHVLESFERQKRYTISSDSNQRYGKTLYLELLLVNDVTYYHRRRGDINFLNQRSKEIANLINGMYSPLNIQVALVGVVTLYNYEFPYSTSGDDIVKNFAKYRAEKLNRQYHNDNAHLMIYIPKLSDDDRAIGKATLDSICTHKKSSGWTRDFSDINFLIASTIAHEIGHNFGMHHDDESCYCAAGTDQCLMWYSGSNDPLHHWSSCSVRYMKATFAKGLDVCLKNIPTYTSGPLCGNGFLESGEECDCGLKEYCANKCCDSATCKLLPNAACGNGECCDLSTCQPKAERTQCRDPVSECDFPEFCDGKSASCPADTYLINGIECKSGEAYCYNGQCQSHAGQCELLWGYGVPVAADECFQYNSRGTVNGNCGYDKISQTFRACRVEDNRCGILHCAHENQKLKIGYEFANQLGYINILKGSRYEFCRTAVIDFGTVDPDPGMVPDGAKCGDKMMCVDQRCIPASTFKGDECSQKCNGNGKCNNKGNCHCDYGKEPPDCLKSGQGGSIDSGPASNLAYERMVLALYIVFLGVVPLAVIAIIVVLYYCKRRNRFRRF